MPAGKSDTEVLLARTGAGDVAARQRLLEQHRDRLRRLVAVRLDRRLAARADASDVLQESAGRCGSQTRRLPARPAAAVLPVARQLAWERMVKLRRLHTADRRSVDREEPPELSETSAVELTQQLAASVTGPVQRLVREELWARVRSALDRLSAADREVLILRHAEQLPTRQAAAVLGASEAAVKSRHLRALERLREALGGNPLEESS